ncbi:Diacylglycerol kinase theta, partial [Geodia barretti]
MAEQNASSDGEPLKEMRPRVSSIGRGAGGPGDQSRRRQFKARSRELERGVSVPVLSPGSEAKAPLPLSTKEVVSVGHGQGHEFVKKTFFQPTFCHHCAELLWGLKGQGMKCMICNFVSHEKCIPNLSVSCRHIIAGKITDPVAHQWTQPRSFHRKKWCNVCRKRIHAKGVICEVCKLYSHTVCKANAFNNCKNCATYNNGVKQEIRHHWIEGNLTSSARCVVCTKNCSTENSLSGFRCGWCGYNVHSACIGQLEEREANERVCTHRDLWHLVLAPRAVTHRQSVKSHVEQEREEEAVDGE